MSNQFSNIPLTGKLFYLSNKSYLLIVLVLVIILSLINKGTHDLQEWDESRNGVNAYEMMLNGDYVNFYYNGTLDTWNAKPPLMIWCIVGSYKILGCNEFALRFPTTLSTILFFILCFNIITLFESGFIAFFTCLILLAGKGILGNHIGLTGDFDMLLLTLLTASVYTFIFYLHYKKKYALYLTAILTGLAFYTKGPAALFFVPGFILYAAILKKIPTILKDIHFWIATILFLIISSSWFFLIYKYGQTSEQSVYGSKNAIETMLIHDTFNRLTSKNSDKFVGSDSSVLFFFRVLDARLNLWNYVFYLGILSVIYFLFKSKRNILNFITSTSNNFILLSICLIMPLLLVLTFTANQHNWYLAPTFMFIAFLTAKGALFIGSKWKPFYVISLLLMLFTLGRQIHYVFTLSTSMHHGFTNNKNLKERTVVTSMHVKQDLLLYLKWLNVKLIQIEEDSDLTKYKGELMLSELPFFKDRFVTRASAIEVVDNYCIARIQ